MAGEFDDDIAANDAPETSAPLGHDSVGDSQCDAAGHHGTVNARPVMTGGDIWRVLRANLWLIILLLILGAGAGYGINVFLERNDSSWTAASLLRVETPINYDMAHLNQPLWWILPRQSFGNNRRQTCCWIPP